MKQFAHLLFCRIGIFLCAALTTPAFADLGEAQVFKDWLIACDNTRHCEAVGYGPEEASDKPVALRLARDAGVGSSLSAMLMVENPDADGNSAPEGNTKPLSMKVGNLTIKNIKPDGVLNAAQVAQLLPMLLKNQQAEITDGKIRWILSLAGINAALLKMDDLQGRIGTTGALIRKGPKPDSASLPPLPEPTIRVISLSPKKGPDDALIKPILKAVTDQTCFEDLPDTDNPETAIIRISATQVLLVRECGRAAYQNDSGIWLANAKPPHAPKRLLLPEPFGKPNDFVVSLEFDDGRIYSLTKGRGIADCGSTRQWGWTGREFALLAATEAPMCRGLAMGGFAVRTFTSKSVPQN